MNHDDIVKFVKESLPSKWPYLNDHDEIVSIETNDNDSFDYQIIKSESRFYEILVTNFNEYKINSFNLWNKDVEETITVLIRREPEPELARSINITFMPGIGKRLINAPRNTDFSYYLETILPSLSACYVTEVECRDYY